MKLTLLLFVANIASIGCVAGAIYLAAHGLTGWGWFLVCACLLGAGYDRKEAKR